MPPHDDAAWLIMRWKIAAGRHSSRMRWRMQRSVAVLCTLHLTLGASLRTMEAAGEQRSRSAGHGRSGAGCEVRRGSSFGFDHCPRSLTHGLAAPGGAVIATRRLTG